MTSPSATTRDPSRLGTIADLRRRTQALAVLDLLLHETPEHQFARAEGLVEGVELAGRGNGAGDDVLVVFTAEGALVRGFDHESPMSPYNPDVALAHLSDDELEEMDLGEQLRLQEELRPFPGVLDPVPAPIRELLAQLDRDPARPVPIPSVLTFCLWHPHDGDGWQVGEIAFPEHEDPDGSEFLLGPYSWDAVGYHAQLERYVGRPIPLALVEAVFDHAPLTPELVGLVEAPRELDELLEAVRSLGYGA